MLEGHHRAGHRDAALLLDLHPVGAGAAIGAARLDLAGEVDGAAEQEELLGQRRLAGIRVRDDGKGAPVRSAGGAVEHVGVRFGIAFGGPLAEGARDGDRPGANKRLAVP
jgi:hypothetical protein